MLVLGQEPTLISMLRGRKSSRTSLRTVLADASQDLGLSGRELYSSVCIGYALLKTGADPDEISRLLSWQEFEHLSAALLRVSGYTVRENVVLTKPRAQLDIVATGQSIILSVDCKHYRKGHGPSALQKFAMDQLRRSDLLRKRTIDHRLIASVVLSLSEPEGRFVHGVAIVPIRTLRTFLADLESFTGLLELK